MFDQPAAPPTLQERIAANRAKKAAEQQERKDKFSALVAKRKAEKAIIEFKDGETRPFSDVAKFLDQHVYGKEVGARIPNPIFSVGVLSDSGLSKVAQFIPGFGSQHANVRVSGRSLKHSDEQRHDAFYSVIGKLPKIVGDPVEVLHNPSRENSAFVVYESDNNYLIVLEISKNGNGTDIVNVVTTRDRGLKKYREKSAA